MNVAWSPLRSFREPEAWNALLGFIGQKLPLARPASFVTFELAETPPATSLTFSVRPSAGPRFLASFRRFPFEGMFGVKVTAEDLVILPQALRDAILQGMAALVWDAIPDNRLGAFSIEPAGAEPELAAVEWFGAKIEGLTPEPIEAVVGCSERGLHEFFFDGRTAPQQIDRVLRARLCVDAHISIGRLALPVADARRLALGDVVMLAAGGDVRFDVRVGRAIYEIEARDDGWIVVATRWQSPEPAGALEKGARMPSDETSETLDVSKLIIDVDFDIGRVSKPLAEIETWRPGSIIALDAPQLTDGVEVTLRVNGGVIGVGDLIKIDDRLAVRINRWTR